MNFRFSVLLFGLGLAAAGRAQSASTFDLSPWATTGQITAGTAPQVLLSGATQMSRQIPSTTAQVCVVSQPAFATERGSWPVLEVGPVAVVFALIDATPCVVLADGPATPIVLSLRPTLGPDGRSDQPVAIAVELPRHRIRVTMGRESLEVPVAVTDTPDVEVVLSAGMDRPWAIDALSIPPIRATVAEQPGGLSRGAARSTTQPATSRPAGSTATSFPAPAEGKGSERPTPPSASGRPAQTGALRSLELFTPPAVRHGRAEVVRAKVAGKSGEAVP